jgi:hypothetical protein
MNGALPPNKWDWAWNACIMVMWPMGVIAFRLGETISTNRYGG